MKLIGALSFEKTKTKKGANLKIDFFHHFSSVTRDEHNKSTFHIFAMDPNQQQPQYPPQFFYPDPNQQMYPQQGLQPVMIQPGMVPPPYQMPQHPQPVIMAPQTTGYVMQPQSPVMTVVAPMGHNVVPNTIPQQVSYVTPAPDDASLLSSPTPTSFLDRSIKERLFEVSHLSTCHTYSIVVFYNFSNIY